MLDPTEFVRDDDGVAVLEVFQAAGVGISFGVRKIFVLAVFVHGFQVLRHTLFVVPLNSLDVGPGFVARRVDELLAEFQVHACAAPEELGRLFGPAISLLIFHGFSFALDFSVTADVGFGPGPISEVRHEPDLRVLGATGVGPLRRGRDAVVDVENEFNVRKGIGRGDDSAVKRMKCCEAA